MKGFSTEFNVRARTKSVLEEMTPGRGEQKVYRAEVSAEESLNLGPWFEDEQGTYAVVTEIVAEELHR